TLDCTNVEQSFEDVRTYLRDEFNRIYRDHPETMGNIPKPWPPTAISNFLVDKSSGYFIYASTIIKFIDDEDSRPTERLALVQNLVPDSDSDRPFAALDQLYTQILSRVPVRYHDKLCAILCARDNFELSIEQIEQLLELAQGDVMLILHRLQSLLHIEFHTIHFYHASFLDLLHDPSRSTMFHIGLHHRIQLARSVLKAFSISSRPQYRHDGVMDVAWSVVLPFNIPAFTVLIMWHVGRYRNQARQFRHGWTISFRCHLPWSLFPLFDFSSLIGSGGMTTLSLSAMPKK
ncbi:hypothetical protein B0H14DRAFT_2404096, partial [Mycena olivaceomarginata]